MFGIAQGRWSAESSGEAREHKVQLVGVYKPEASVWKNKLQEKLRNHWRISQGSYSQGAAHCITAIFNLYFLFTLQYCLRITVWTESQKQCLNWVADALGRASHTQGPPCHSTVIWAYCSCLLPLHPSYQKNKLWRKVECQHIAHLDPRGKVLLGCMVRCRDSVYHCTNTALERLQPEQLLVKKTSQITTHNH